MATTPSTTFQIDNATLEEIEKLKSVFGAKDSVEVIRKALALAKVAAANTGADKVLTIVSPDAVHQKVKLAE
jgi:hypothetical protein